MDRFDFLRSFHSISDEEYEVLTGKLRPRQFTKGQRVISPGETQRELYFVKSGVQMVHIDTDIKPHVLAFTYSANICSIPGSFSSRTLQVPIYVYV